jgi:hypothetical protein
MGSADAIRRGVVQLLVLMPSYSIHKRKLKELPERGHDLSDHRRAQANLRDTL